MEKVKKVEATEAVKTFEDTIRENGIRSLSLDDIKNYKNILKIRLEQIKKDIMVNRFFGFSFSLLGAVDIAHCYSSLSKLPGGIIEEYAAISLALTGAAAILTGIVTGIAMESNFELKQERKVINETTELLDDNIVARTK